MNPGPLSGHSLRPPLSGTMERGRGSTCATRDAKMLYERCVRKCVRVVEYAIGERLRMLRGRGSSKSAQARPQVIDLDTPLSGTMERGRGSTCATRNAKMLYERCVRKCVRVVEYALGERLRMLRGRVSSKSAQARHQVIDLDTPLSGTMERRRGSTCATQDVKMLYVKVLCISELGSGVCFRRAISYAPRSGVVEIGPKPALGLLLTLRSPTHTP